MESEDFQLALLKKRLWISLLFGSPALFLMLNEMLPGDIILLSNPLTRHWVEMIAVTPVICYGGWPFFKNCLVSLKQQPLALLNLVSGLVLIATIYSVVATLFPALFVQGIKPGHFPPVYFTATLVLVLLMLAAKVIKLTAKNKLDG